MSEHGKGDLYENLKKIDPDLVAVVKTLYGAFAESGTTAQRLGELKPDQRRAINNMFGVVDDPRAFAESVLKLLQNRDAMSLAVSIFNAGHSDKAVRDLSYDEYKRGIQSAMTEFASFNGITDINFGE